MHATSADKPKVCEALLAKGASVSVADADGWTALHVCALNGSASCLPSLLAAGADAGAEEADGRTAWALAMENGNEVELSALRDAAPEKKKRKKKAKKWVAKDGN